MSHLHMFWTRINSQIVFYETNNHFQIISRTSVGRFKQKILFAEKVAAEFY